MKRIRTLAHNFIPAIELGLGFYGAAFGTGLYVLSKHEDNTRLLLAAIVVLATGTLMLCRGTFRLHRRISTTQRP